MNKIRFNFIITFFIIIVPFFTFGQNKNLSVSSADSLLLSSQPIPIGEVVVSSLRIDRKIKELPSSMVVIGINDCQKHSSLSLSNILNNKPGISLGGDGIWATNINIRGINENRLVTLIDGNRIETATDLTASLSMVDINDIERVEIIKGAQSSLYGTGAIGGIINIITKDGHFASSPYINGNIISGFASANTMYTNNIEIKSGSKNWYLRVSGSYLDADDIYTPKGNLDNSQFTMNNISTKFGFKPFPKHLLKIQYQRNWSTDVGIPGGKAFPGPAEATYSDIGRHLIQASYEISDLSEKLSSLKFNYFTQYILRDVSMNPNTTIDKTLPNGNIQKTTPILVTPTGKHLTNGIQLQSSWDFHKNSLIAGIDFWGRELKTEREKQIKMEIITPEGKNIKTNNIIRGETPIPKSKFNSAGLFLQNETKLFNNRLTLITGGRIDEIWINNEKGVDVDYLIINDKKNDNPPAQRITFEKGDENNFSWSANAGFLYNLTKSTDLSLNLARSFRAPSLEERFKYIDLGNLVRLGNPQLDPEKAYSADLGLRIWKPKYSLHSGIFINRIKNMIIETPGEFIYTLTSDTSPDTIPALINSNVSKALLYGFDFGIDYNFYKNFIFSCSSSFVRAKDTESDKNLPQIPPFNGRIGLRYTNAKLGVIEINLSGAAKQNKIAKGEKKTSGYCRLDVAVSTKQIILGKIKWQIFSGIDNVTNKSYTNHLSTNRGANSVEPGRNFFIRLLMSF